MVRIVVSTTRYDTISQQKSNVNSRRLVRALQQLTIFVNNHTLLVYYRMPVHGEWTYVRGTGYEASCSDLDMLGCCFTLKKQILFVN